MLVNKLVSNVVKNQLRVKNARVQEAEAFRKESFDVLHWDWEKAIADVSIEAHGPLVGMNIAKNFVLQCHKIFSQ